MCHLFPPSRLSSLCSPGPAPSLGAKERDAYDAVTIAAVADDVATLRVLIDLGASAKLVDQPPQRHGPHRGRTHSGTTRW
jgi:hypothetical protein